MNASRVRDRHHWPGASRFSAEQRLMQNLSDIIAEFGRQPLLFWPGFEPHHVSFELDGDRVMKRCDDTVTELARVGEIQSWGFIATDVSTISVCHADRTIIVVDHHGTLQEILKRVAAKQMTQF